MGVAPEAARTLGPGPGLVNGAGGPGGQAGSRATTR